VARDGQRVFGERRNEDAFSIQLAERNGRLRGFQKSGLREIIRDTSPSDARVGAVTTSASSRNPSITFRDLLDGLKDPTGWLTYSGDYTSMRHSPLKEITPDNVHRLASVWAFQTGTMTRGRGCEGTALELDGVLYVTGSNNFAWALDGRTGRPFWQYRRELPSDLTYGASAPVNRGFAIL